MEKAILCPDGFIDITLNAIRFSYPRLVYFIDKITHESAQYFQITPTSEEHRIYDGGLYQGRNYFTPGERLQMLFNGIWD